MKRLAYLIILFTLSIPIATAQSEDTGGLLSRGKVIKIQTERSHKGYVRLLLNLSLEFSNASSVPVIMIRPWDEQGYWHGGASLATTRQNAQSNRNLFADDMWEAITGSDSYRRLAQALDQPRPPKRLTRILKPGNSWKWRTSVVILFEESTRWKYPPQPTWEEMKAQPSPLWLCVQFEMWPFNTEYFKPNLASRLQKRWRNIGHLWIGSQYGRMHLARLDSEPIELDWKAALIH